ncbi:unnamed protein product, partial [marine sediment metagenome]
RIVQKGSYNNQYRFLAEDGLLKFDLYGVTYGTLTTTLPITDHWHHIAGLYSNSQNILQIWIDGIKVKENTIANGNILTTSDPLFIGTTGHEASTFDHFYGMIDEVRIWDVARTQAEILANMNNELFGSEPGLMGYWRFNEGLGTTISDRISYSNEGSLNGGLTWIRSTAPIVANWLYCEPASGTVPMDSLLSIKVIFDATDLETGVYNENIIVFSNDPDERKIVVPISMNIYSPVLVENFYEFKSKTFTLHQNYPNPFSQYTIINYDIFEKNFIT